MLAQHNWTAVLRMSALTIPIVVATWLLSVPTLIGASGFFASVALLVAFGWVVLTTCRNAQPASSLAQSLHDADHGSSPTHQRRTR
ncbi:MAG TPA: hypothetical protein VD833_01300 [Vicinamibacterales bacterium]|nr:hypothetical protein [Vicinamibacterales bacterium]